jgi:predicted transcriptional regulator
MFDGLFGTETAGKMLLYLSVNEEAYTQELSDNLKLPLFCVQKQLQRLLDKGILVCQQRGRMRFYSFNPRFPLKHELRALLHRARDFLPEEEQQLFAPQRRRPRAPGKPTKFS